MILPKNGQVMISATKGGSGYQWKRKTGGRLTISGSLKSKNRRGTDLCAAGHYEDRQFMVFSEINARWKTFIQAGFPGKASTGCNKNWPRNWNREIWSISSALTALTVTMTKSRMSGASRKRKSTLSSTKTCCHSLMAELCWRGGYKVLKMYFGVNRAKSQQNSEF